MHPSDRQRYLLAWILLEHAFIEFRDTTCPISLLGEQFSQPEAEMLMNRLRRMESVFSKALKEVYPCLKWSTEKEFTQVDSKDDHA